MKEVGLESRKALNEGAQPVRVDCCGGLLIGRLLVGDPKSSNFFGLQDFGRGLSLPGPFAPSRVPTTGPVLLVVRVRFAEGPDSVDLFVNPAPGDSAPGTPDASMRLEIGEAVPNLSLLAWGAAAGDVSYRFDELRYGHSFADVAPAGGAPVATVKRLALTPSRVRGGRASAGTLTLSRPAPEGGATIALSSSSRLATVPGSVHVPAGADTAAFSVSTARVSRAREARITASVEGAGRSALLRIRRSRRRSP